MCLEINISFVMFINHNIWVAVMMTWKLHEFMQMKKPKDTFNGDRFAVNSEKCNTIGTEKLSRNMFIIFYHR